MVDTIGISDNSLATQRIINSGFGPQVFQNTGTDTSYSLDPTDTQDFYRLRLSRRSSVVANLSNLSANANLEFYDSSGVLQNSTNDSTLSDVITTTPLDAGDYYIRVFLQDNTTTTNYSLTVNTISDTRADLLWRNYSTGQNAVWLMNGTSIGSTPFTTTVSDPSWMIQATGDMNGDNTQDYIWRNATNGQNVVWVMNGTAVQSSQYLPTVPGSWTIQGAADLSGDGKTDLLWRNPTTGENVIWYMDGLSYVSAVYLPAVTDSNWQISAVGKFGTDANPDIVWRNYATGQNVVWLMNGTSIASSVTLTNVTDVSWRIVGAGDFNGDGQTDLAWRNTGSGQNVVWLMNGTSLVSSTFLATVTDLNWRVASVVNTPGVTDLGGGAMNTAFDLGRLSLSLTSGTVAGSYSDTVGGLDANEFYRINLTSATNLTLAIGGLSSDANLFLIQDRNNNGFLDPGEVLQSAVTQGSGAASLTRTVSAGNYFVRVSSTAQSSPYQLTVRGVAAQQIDLVPDTFSAATAPFTVTTTSGNPLPATVNISTAQSVRINYRVANSPSSVATATPFRISFYLSRDNVITTSDRLLGNVNPNTGFSDADVIVNSLAPYNSSTRTPLVAGNFNLTLPTSSDSWWGGDQTYYIGMIVDSANQVAESNEANNTAFAAINIVGTSRPDVIGGGFNIVSMAGTQTVFQPGQTARVTGTIRNIGNTATGSARFPVLFYISNSDFIDPTDSVNTRLLGTAYITSIAAQSSTTFDSINVQSGSTLPPSYFVGALVLPDRSWSGWRGNGRYYIGMQLNIFNIVSESDGGRENNMNYGKAIGQYIDYNFFDITGF